ncbi:unnamed protein product, partial [Phaeothamnion confervicola]
MVLNVAAFSLQVNEPWITDAGARTARLFKRYELYRLLTSIFLHANPAHLACNMAALHDVGGLVEKCFGWRRMLVTYLAAGVAGGLLGYWRQPYATSVGASGAVFGMMGALTQYSLQNRGVIAGANAILPALLRAIAANLINGVTTPGIDNWAHVGGLLAGVL